MRQGTPAAGAKPFRVHIPQGPYLEVLPGALSHHSQLQPPGAWQRLSADAAESDLAHQRLVTALSRRGCAQGLGKQNRGGWQEGGSTSFVSPKSNSTGRKVDFCTKMFPGCGSALNRPSTKIFMSHSHIDESFGYEQLTRAWFGSCQQGKAG